MNKLIILIFVNVIACCSIDAHTKVNGETGIFITSQVPTTGYIQSYPIKAVGLPSWNYSFTVPNINLLSQTSPISYYDNGIDYRSYGKAPTWYADGT